MGRTNLFAGLLDIQDSLPNLESQSNVESQFEHDQAVIEGAVIEKNIETELIGIEDAQDVLEEMKEVIVRHESNVQAMNGEEVGGDATAPNGEVVAQVPADQQPQVDSNSSNQEVAEQNNDLQQGTESVCGRLFGATSAEVFKALRINNPYVGYQGGLNSITGINARIAYEEGLNGIKELASKVWFKIKAMIQSLLQWISKWITKAAIWIKGYEKKADSLKKEAESVQDSAKAKEDYKFTQFASLLVQEEKLVGGYKDVFNALKDYVRADNGFIYQNIKIVIQKLKEGKNSSSNNEPKENAGNNSIKLFHAGMLSEPTPEQAKDGGDKPSEGEGSQAPATKDDTVAAQASAEMKKAFDDWNNKQKSGVFYAMASKSGKEGCLLGPVNMKQIAFYVIENEGTGKIETVDIFKEAPKPADVNSKINGAWVKKSVTNICDAVKSNISEVKTTLDNGNSAFNKFRNETFAQNFEGVSSPSDLGKHLIFASKLMQKGLTISAYLPSYYLNAASEYIKSVKGGESSSETGGIQNKTEGENNKQPENNQK